MNCFSCFNKVTLFCLTALCFYHSVEAQNAASAHIYKIYSTHTSFPDSARYKGYVYDSVLYSAREHYQDSTVLLVVPNNLNKNKKVDLLFWFHGWRHQVDSTITEYELLQQWQAAHLNAILVLPETARNAPDSYGGKLERSGEFDSLLHDVWQAMIAKRVLSKNTSQGNILLAGHSGAYRVIANILKYGGVPVKEVVLFDALYGEVDKFTDWIDQDTTHRFINWYTDQGGGTNEVSLAMIQTLLKQNKRVCTQEENTMKDEELKSCPLIFIHSPRAHNDIINRPDNFLRVVQSSPFLTATH